MSADQPNFRLSTVVPRPVSPVLDDADYAVQLARLGAIVESSDDAILSKTLEGRILTWNAGAERIFGYTAAEIIGQHITTLIPRELYIEEQHIIEKVKRGERVDHFETVRLHKSGRRLDLSITVSPIRDATGMIVGASKVGRDISERARAQQLMRENEALLSSEAEALTNLNNWSSRLWRCESIDEGLNEMLAAVLELLGASKGVVQLIQPERDTIVLAAQRGYPTGFLEAFREIPTQGPYVGSEAVRKNERIIVNDYETDERFAHSRVRARESGLRASVSTPIISGDGSSLGVVSICFDAVHHPTDQDLRRLDLYLRLAGDFIQRGRMEQALQKSQEDLRDADRRKDEFLATLAHELRNPLAPIRQAAIIGKSPLVTPSQLLWSQNVIERQVQHMALLLEDLLDVSRISRGRLEMRKEIVDLKKVIESAVETARPLIDGKHHTLIVDLPTQEIRLSVDPLRIAQVIGNLLNNSAKYTNAHGQIYLSVRVTPVEIEIAVRDNGAGLSAESMKEIFQMFSQVKSTLDQADGGLGIGLSLAKGLVELHGGRIEVASEGRGHGSVFTVHLPSEAEQSHINLSSVETAAPTLAGSKILVADDNVDAAESLSMLLQMDGHEVQTVFNGEAAFEIAREFRPAFAVLDIGMPKLNGYMLAKALRAEDWGQKMILVAVTGWGQEEDKNKTFAAGFDFHLTKPIDPAKLKAVLMEATSKRSA